MEHSTYELPQRVDTRPPSELGLSKSPYSTMALCSCMTVSTYESHNWSTRYLNFFRSSTITCTHQKNCPLRVLPRKKAVMGMGYSHCGLFLSRILFFSISITRGAGGSSISPNLTFRATVSDTSPAFALFDGQELIDARKRGLVGSCSKWMARKLYYLFREQKASPSDVNSRGETLLHVSDSLLIYR